MPSFPPPFPAPLLPDNPGPPRWPRPPSCLPAGWLDRPPEGARVTVAGLVLVRQRPGKGNAIFVTLEDESGVANLLIWSRLFERMRRAVMTARLMVAGGIVQRSAEGVIHLMTDSVADASHLLGQLEEAQAEPTEPDRARHPRNVRVLPKSRDFH